MRRRTLPSSTVALACAFALCVLGLAACGDDGSSTTPIQQQAAAANAQKLKDLAAQNLQRNTEPQTITETTAAPEPTIKTVTVVQPAAPPAPSTPQDDSSESIEFHAPSGNVSCRVATGGAVCTVASTGVTFTLDGGERAQQTDETVLSRGTGEARDYGDTVTVGSVSCSIPSANSPHGITCYDSDSGHGFEASRVSARQRTY